MKRFIYVLIAIILITSCGKEQKCINAMDLFDINSSKEVMNNAFEIYEGSKGYENLLSNKNIDYQIKEIPIDVDDDFVKKAQEKTDSLNIKRDSIGTIKLNYFYYAKWATPIYPVLIQLDKILLIRCKKQQDAGISCDEGLLNLNKRGEAVYGKYELNLVLTKDDLLDKETIVFEPQESKCYLINVKENLDGISDHR